jgi:hypothetical protein
MKTVNRNEVETLFQQVAFQTKKAKAMEELRQIFKNTDCCGNCSKYKTMLCACVNMVDADYPEANQWCQAHAYDDKTREERYTTEQKELVKRRGK